MSRERKRVLYLKRCSRCHESKPRVEFSNRQQAADGKMPHCKACDVTERSRVPITLRKESLSMDQIRKRVASNSSGVVAPRPFAKARWGSGVSGV